MHYSIIYKYSSAKWIHPKERREYQGAYKVSQGLLDECQPLDGQSLFLGVPTSVRHPLCNELDTAQTHVYNAVLKWVRDPDVRKDMYVVGNSCTNENLHVRE